MLLQLNSFIHHIFTEAVPCCVLDAGGYNNALRETLFLPSQRSLYLGKDQALIEYSYRCLRKPRRDARCEGKVGQGGP